MRWLEAMLFVIAAVTLVYCGYVRAESFLSQRAENEALDQVLRSRSDLQHATPSVPAASPIVQPGDRIGRIEIQRLGVSAIVLAGSDSRTLRRAVGHIPGTPLPGVTGNVGLAAHRDTFFRRLEDVHRDDVVVVTTATGTFYYRVTETRIVEPDDVWVLDPTPGPTLTLVTCYPFTYVGNAPQRFIVHATLDQVERLASAER